jgi:hypothetical protein
MVSVKFILFSHSQFTGKLGGVSSTEGWIEGEEKRAQGGGEERNTRKPTF